jgi:hypothetical protein
VYFFLKIYLILDVPLTCSALLEESKLIEANAGVDGGGAHIVRVMAKAAADPKKMWCMGPYAVVDNNLILCSLIHHGNWATLCQSRL